MHTEEDAQGDIIKMARHLVEGKVAKVNRGEESAEFNFSNPFYKGAEKIANGYNIEKIPLKTDIDKGDNSHIQDCTDINEKQEDLDLAYELPFSICNIVYEHPQFL